MPVLTQRGAPRLRLHWGGGGDNLPGRPSGFTEGLSPLPAARAPHTAGTGPAPEPAGESSLGSRPGGAVPRLWAPSPAWHQPPPAPHRLTHIPGSSQVTSSELGQVGLPGPLSPDASLPGEGRWGPEATWLCGALSPGVSHGHGRLLHSFTNCLFQKPLLPAFYVSNKFLCCHFLQLFNQLSFFMNDSSCFLPFPLVLSEF